MYEQLLAVRCDNEISTHSKGLAAQRYTDPAHFEIEKRAIFYRSWVCVGHVCMAKAPGEYFVANIVDQEVLVVRNTSGQLNAFFNACQHRGHPVMSGRGQCARFVCPYHAWSYDLDGRLIQAPHTQRVSTFEPGSVTLAPVAIDTLAGAVFVNLDVGAPDLHSLFEGLEAEILAHKPDVVEQELVYDNPLAHHCNWKVSVENFSECYHCGPVHGYLTDNIIDPESYQLSANALVQRHVVEARDSAMTQRLWHVWPNTAMGLYPIPNVGLVWCIRHMYAVRHDESIYHYRWFCDVGGAAQAVREYAEHHAQTTGAEDAAVSAGVQRGMGSLGFERARLFSTPANGVSSEHVIRYFHDLVRTAVS
mgnify:FL=1